MSEIFVTWEGDGLAYVDNYFPQGGDTVALTCIPDPHCSLIDIIATDSHGYSVALAVTEYQEFVYNKLLGDINIHVIFSEIPFIYKNLWILKPKDWWRKNNKGG